MTRINERSDEAAYLTTNAPAVETGGVGLAEPPRVPDTGNGVPESTAAPTVAGAATAAAPNAVTAAALGPPCVHCGTPVKKGQAWCLRCGYYPVLKTFVELDESEKLSVEVAADGSVVTAIAQPAPKSTLEVWKGLIPPWGWWLIAGVAVLLAISLAARFTVQMGTPRAIWTWVQFFIGIAAAITAHVTCYMHAIMINDSLSFLDMVLKPWVIWNTTLHELPRSFKRVALGTWGLSAALFAALVVGGVKYDEIIDWGKVPPKKKAKKHVAVPLGGLPANEDKSMEEALNDFTDKAGILTDEEKEKLLAEKRKNAINCVIIGFLPHRENDFHALVLAGEPEGKMRWIGMVSTGIPDDVRAKLNKEMRRMLRSTPAVPCKLEAFWIDPKLKCTVKFEDWSPNKRLVNPGFEKLLVELNQPAANPPAASGDQASAP